jgi:hypothetical protein
MSVAKSFNTLALQGLDFDDMEFVQQFNLDPKVAYTPEINMAMLDHVYQKQVNGLMAKGMSREKASVEAGRRRAKSRKEIMQMIK